MLTKFATFCVIFSICWIHIAGNNLNQYGYNDMDGNTSTERLHDALRCVNANPQKNVDFEQIMGLWYGSEVIIHSQQVQGIIENEYDTCVIVHLTDVTSQVNYNNNRQGYNSYNNNNNNNNNYYNNNQNQNQNQNNYRHSSTTPRYLSNDDYPNNRQVPENIRYLRLVWSEKDRNVEYTFNYTTDAPGVWSNIGDQRGTFVVPDSYTQFQGTVQVVKAVNDHLVLTFCGNDVKSSIYTVVLTRNRLGLSADELRGIRGMLTYRSLYLNNVRKVCNAAASLGGGIYKLLLPLLLISAACWARRQ